MIFSLDRKLVSNQTNLVLYVGNDAFPIGMAQTQRQVGLSKTLTMAGFGVFVLCRSGTYPSGDDNPSPRGEFEGINYFYCSGYRYRNPNFFIRNYLKVKGCIVELISIHFLIKKNSNVKVFISTNGFFRLFVYSIFARLHRVETVLDTTEFWEYHSFSFRSISDWLYNQYSFFLVNKVICISTFLEEAIQKKKNPKDILKIPCISDFQKFEAYKGKRSMERQYFLFVASRNYLPVIQFVIDSFNAVSGSEYSLLLVCGDAGEADKANIGHYISRSRKSNHIHLFGHLKYPELIELYANSAALLIPLRDTRADIARFPQKIAEYLASGRPIVTTGFGEICHYFKDGQNAFVCADYNEDEFGAKMNEVFRNPERTEMIADAGYQTGLLNFDYRSISRRVITFLN